MAERRNWTSSLLRILVAAGLTAYILWKSRPADVLAAAAHADWRLIAVAVMLVLADRALMAYRWVVLLCTLEADRRPPLGALMRIFFVSTFIGTFLPASVGGEAVRAYSLSKLDVGIGDAVASVFMDRMLGVASLLLLAVSGLLLARDLAGNVTILASLAVAAAICMGTLIVIFSETAAAWAARLIAMLPGAAQALAQTMLTSVRRYAIYHRQLVNVLGGSVVVQILRIVQAYFIGRGLGIEASLVAYFSFIPLILLVMLLPVTFNGIGTSQAAFVWFFARIGVPAAASFALSVLFVALGIVGNLPGGLLYATGGKRR
jgi:uncharacterized protein (TIRG00374 family)